MQLNNNINTKLIRLAIEDSECRSILCTSLGDNFFKGVEAKAFKTIKHCFTSGLPLDFAIFESEMLRQNVSPNFVSSVFSEGAHPDSVFGYIEAARMRSCATGLHAYKGKIDKIISEASNKDALVDFATKELQAVFEDSGMQNDDVKPLKSSISPLLSKLADRAASNKPTLGLSTGIQEYDQLTGGLMPTDLIVIAGRPSMGKTALALSMIYNSIKQGLKGLFVSLEMPSEQLLLRLMSMRTGIDQDVLKSGRYSQRQQQAISEAFEWVENEISLYVTETPQQTFSQVKRKATALHKEGKLHYLVVDYVGIMGVSDTNTDNRTLQIGFITAGLKALAKELDIPVILLAQLSRDLEKRVDKRPMMSDLRESGSIEQDADLVIFPYRDVVYNDKTKEPDKVEIIVAKQRNGATGTALARFHGPTTMFTSYQPVVL